MLKDYNVLFTGQQQAELGERDFDDTLAPGEVLGQNLISLVSTGSERGGFTQLFPPDKYPMATGSSSIARVLKTGTGADSYKPGDLFFHGEHHGLYVKLHESDSVAVPAGLEPEQAVFARYAAVSMTSIYRMRAKAMDKIIVTGLGIVGVMCAQVLNCMGFEVITADPSPERRRIAGLTNITQIYSSLKECSGLNKKAGALIECSGNENAIREALPCLRYNSDVFQVGVPWKKCGDWDAHELLRDLFYGYISLHGGWEWYLPNKPTDFELHSSYTHIRSVMELIERGKIIIPSEMYELWKPSCCDAAYKEIAGAGMKSTSVIFDWRSY